MKRKMEERVKALEQKIKELEPRCAHKWKYVDTVKGKEIGRAGDFLSGYTVLFETIIVLECKKCGLMVKQ